MLQDFDKPYFIVGGEVNHPAKYELRSDIRVTEAVAIAGGLTPEPNTLRSSCFGGFPMTWSNPACWT